MKELKIGSSLKKRNSNFCKGIKIFNGHHEIDIFGGLRRRDAIEDPKIYEHADSYSPSSYVEFATNIRKKI